MVQVFAEKANDKLVELKLPPGSEPISSEPGCHDPDDPYLYDPYEYERSKADLVHVNGEESLITQRGAESKNVNFYLLRNK